MKTDHFTLQNAGFVLIQSENGKHRYLRKDDNVIITTFKQKPYFKVEIVLFHEGWVSVFKNRTPFEKVESWIESKYRAFR